VIEAQELVEVGSEIVIEAQELVEIGSEIVIEAQELVKVGSWREKGASWPEEAG
jgi:hypothetical protein